jgi:hypothetical protein
MLILNANPNPNPNQLVHAFEVTDVPTGQSFPAPHPGVVKGQEGGVPYSGAHVYMSASQAFHFAQHSIAVIEPLLPPAARDTDPAWLSWKAHVAYLQLALQHKFTKQCLLKLAAAVKKHHELYQAVEQYSAVLL